MDEKILKFIKEEKGVDLEIILEKFSGIDAMRIVEAIGNLLVEKKIEMERYKSTKGIGGWRYL